MRLGTPLACTFFAAAVISCATVPKGVLYVQDESELPTIQAKHAARLGQLEIGMSLEEFKKILPEAYVAGQNLETTALEFVDIQKFVTQDDIYQQNVWLGFGSPPARTRKQVLWYYFYNGRLVKWGEPQDWPRPADLIIEQRHP